MAALQIYGLWQQSPVRLVRMEASSADTLKFVFLQNAVAKQSGFREGKLSPTSSRKIVPSLCQFETAPGVAATLR